MKTVHCLLALAAALTAGAAGAQTYSGTQTRTAPSVADRTTVGARVELLDVDKVSGTSAGATAFGEYAFNDAMRAGGSVGFWRGRDTSGAEHFDASDLIVGAHVKGLLGDAGSTVRPFATIGADIHRLTVIPADTEDEGNPLSEDENRYVTRAGARVGAGAEIAISDALGATAGLEYRQVFGDEEMRLNQLVFAGGLGYAL